MARKPARSTTRSRRPARKPAAKPASPSASKAPMPPPAMQIAGQPLDLEKFENHHQVGGIRLARLEQPSPGGRDSRVALVDTGSGLRFTVALDRGGDIVEAFHHNLSLTYLSPNDHVPGHFAYQHGTGWLHSWPTGLLTTCGPRYIGPPRVEDGQDVGVHGTFANTPAVVEMAINPDPHQGRHEMLLSLVIRETRMFGPVIEVRRQIQCRLGESAIRIYDQVTNRGNTTSAHNWMYHCNFGYPLADAGSRLILAGKARFRRDEDHPATRAKAKAALNQLKTLRDNLPEHVGSGEQVILLDPPGDGDGLAHVGIINARLNLGVELTYPREALPRLANWQHLGPRGSYVTGVEPFNGSLDGKDADDHPLAPQWLEPGQTRRYQLTITVHTQRDGLLRLARHDRDLEPTG
jgi:hypothetical protein